MEAALEEENSAGIVQEMINTFGELIIIKTCRNVYIRYNMKTSFTH